VIKNLWSLLFLSLGVAMRLPAADAERGAAVLQNEGCLECHRVRGEGAQRTGTTAAPDLGARIVPDYTVSALASAVWNHTPAMWAQISSRVMAQPSPTEADWEDVFLYLYSLQFSGRPALARRGERLFELKQCANCHVAANGDSSFAKPVSAWARLDDPIELISQMWNHASSMKKEFTGRGGWKKLSGRDVLDLTVYLQRIQNIPRNTGFSLPNAQEGRALVAEHCGKCHAGQDSLAAILRNKTLMDIGAAVWNHGPLMETMPVIPAADMRKMVAYVWELQYRGPSGVASRGERVFENKMCISCHRSPTPKGAAQSPRPGKTFTPYSMAALGWGSGREMHNQMLEKGIRWPHLLADDISNLVAYMNTLNR
jgi:cytochrome c551/c552